MVLTKADQIEGWCEFTGSLSAERQAEAFGWTSDQRRLADPAERITDAFSQIRARLDGMLHELLLREPDPTGKRRMFVFPQEVEELGRAAARFVAAAFKRDIYHPIPFLRGLYLVSSVASGQAVSPTLQRLGQGWGATVHAEGGPSPRGLRELFTEVIIGDDELAIPKSRLGPKARRGILGAGGLVALAVLVVWGLSFAQNYTGTHALEREAQLALSSDPTIEQVAGLRGGIEQRESESESYLNRLGFRFLARAVRDAKRTFVWSFEKNFDSFTRANLEQELRGRGDRVFRAAVAVATDLEYLATGAESLAPDLAPYLPRRVKDPDGYLEAYGRFVQWMRPTDREQLTLTSSDALSRAAADLISIGPLEEQTRSTAGRFGPVCYAAAGLPAPETSSGGCVPGIYTAAGYDGLFERLIAAVEATGAVPQRRISETKRRYVDRFDRSWRRFLLEVPTDERVDPDVRKSPHLEILEKIHVHTSTDLARDTASPVWIDMIAEVRRGEPSGEQESVAPWTEYTAALENVALDVEEAGSDPEQALLLVREVAEGSPSSFDEALQVVRRIVPRQGDVGARTKLREILEAPLLDGFSAVLDSARSALDRRWSERVVARYDGPLTPQEFEGLYGPGGALDAFLGEELAPFYRDGTSTRLLEGRSMGLGPSFLAWMDRATTLQRTLFAGAGSSIAVRLRGVPSSVSGAADLRVKRRDLRLICPDEQQNFVYREGSGVHTFRWTAECQSLVLRILVGGEGSQDRELLQEWKGPQALPGFLQQGERLGGGVVQWQVDGPEGIRVNAKYRIESGGEIGSIVHEPPPRSMGS
jgi:type VI protein secretion system component VasK